MPTVFSRKKDNNHACTEKPVESSDFDYWEQKQDKIERKPGRKKMRRKEHPTAISFYPCRKITDKNKVKQTSGTVVNSRAVFTEKEYGISFIYGPFCTTGTCGSWLGSAGTGASTLTSSGIRPVFDSWLTLTAASGFSAVIGWPSFCAPSCGLSRK